MKPAVIFTVLLFAVGIARAEWLQEVAISSEPPEDGRVLFTVRILPRQTLKYTALEFECVLHQAFPWEDARGRRYTKIHEPVTFVYRHADARLVDDLDAYFNFRVPVSIERLKRKYGDTTFNTEAGVSVSRIKISGLEGKKEIVWMHEFPAKGVHKIKAPEAEDGNDRETAIEEPPL